MGTAAVTSEPSESLQDRQVRLSGAVLLDALPTADPRLSLRRYFGNERLHQHGLPDAGFARDESDPALPLRAPSRTIRAVAPTPLHDQPGGEAGHVREMVGWESVGFARGRGRFRTEAGTLVSATGAMKR